MNTAWNYFSKKPKNPSRQATTKVTPETATTTAAASTATTGAAKTTTPWLLFTDRF